MARHQVKRAARPPLSKPISAGLAIVAGVLGWSAAAMRRRFRLRLDTLESQLEGPAPTQAPRSDLPPAVMALAARLGAQADRAIGFTRLEQSGEMWRTPGGSPSGFTARQTICHDRPGFLWRAAMRPAITIADYLVAGTGGLEVKMLGALRLARIVGGHEMNRGEGLRYLAELSWCPDAILINRHLDWTVVDAETITVAMGSGLDRAELTLGLSDGVIVSAFASARGYLDKGHMTMRPWQGRFWDYQSIDGRLIPLQGEVSWTLPGGDFTYWRGRIVRWNGHSTT